MKQSMAANFFNRVKEILGNENVDYEPKVVAEVLQKYFFVRLNQCANYRNYTFNVTLFIQGSSVIPQ